MQRPIETGTQALFAKANAQLV